MAVDPDLEKLDEVSKSGVESVFSEGDRVQFQSTSNLLKARDHIARTKRKPRKLRMGRVRLSCSI